MESRTIATALEEEFPSPPLHLNSPILAKVEALMPKITAPLSAISRPRTPRDLLNERSIYYFKKTREERLGMPLDEFEKSENGGEKAWEKATPHLTDLAELLKQTGGPYFMGEIVSHADFVVVGFFQFLKRVSYDDDVFDRAMQIDASFLALYQACTQWLKRDDH